MIGGVIPCDDVIRVFNMKKGKLCESWQGYGVRTVVRMLQLYCADPISR